MREPHIESPLTVVLLLGGTNFAVNVAVLANLSELPQNFLGVGVTALEQAIFGAWTLLGFVIIPNAIFTVIFRVPNVVDKYVWYLLGTIALVFVLASRLWFHGSVCDMIVPVHIQEDFGAAIVCTCVDALATAVGALVFVLALVAVFAVHLVARDMREELLTKEAYGTFAQAKRSLPPAPRTVPQSNPFLMPREREEGPNPFVMPSGASGSPVHMPISPPNTGLPPSGSNPFQIGNGQEVGANPFQMPASQNPFQMPAAENPFELPAAQNQNPFQMPG